MAITNCAYKPDLNIEYSHIFRHCYPFYVLFIFWKNKCRDYETEIQCFYIVNENIMWESFQSYIIPLALTWPVIISSKEMKLIGHYLFIIEPHQIHPSNLCFSTYPKIAIHFYI